MAKRSWRFMGWNATMDGTDRAGNRRLSMSLPVISSPAYLRLALALSQDSGQTFFESIDVNVVNVEVYVTDRDGKRVQGLTRDDFQVLEDGKPVEITNFYAVSEGRVSQSGAAPQGQEEEAAEA